MTEQPSPYDDMHFRAAATESYRQLAYIDRGKKPPPCTTEDIKRARHDALMAIARDFPDPAKFAFYLDAKLAAHMLTAYPSQDPQNCGCLRLDDHPTFVPMLRSMGLVAFGRVPFLGDFGIRVLRELRKDER